jgi:hypothetical protein
MPQFTVGLVWLIIGNVFGRADSIPEWERARAFRWVALLFALALIAGCNRTERTSQRAAPPPASVVAERQQDPQPSPGHDLSLDEAMGGHTLARHVGKTDAELLDRLRREPQISSASTYTDRATAEIVVGAALSGSNRSFDAWRQRTGRRANFVLHYASRGVIGRSISRGRSESAPCEQALVVLHWDEGRHRFYVLTSYPEEKR